MYTITSDFHIFQYLFLLCQQFFPSGIHFFFITIFPGEV